MPTNEEDDAKRLLYRHTASVLPVEPVEQRLKPGTFFLQAKLDGNGLHPAHLEQIRQLVAANRETHC